jgi:hypothetical protein
MVASVALAARAGTVSCGFGKMTGEPVTTTRMLCLVAIVEGVAGLRLLH